MRHHGVGVTVVLTEGSNMTQQRRIRVRRLGILTAVPALAALVLAGCGGGDDGVGGAQGFSFVFPTSTQTESPWQTLADKYSEQTGVEIEAEALPNDSYGLTLRTQLQGGNAADVLVVAPGSGQDYSVLPLAEAGYLEPLTGPSAEVAPQATRSLFTQENQVFAQPTDLVPVGTLWNAGAAAEAGVTFPASTDQLLAQCRTLAASGKSFVAVAGSAPPNMGLTAMSISATRVYAQTPDWNAQRAAGAVTFADSPGWQETIQTIVDMNAAGCFQPGAAGAGFDAITAGITQGSSLAAFVPSGSAHELITATPGLQLEIRAFPPTNGGKEYLLASPNYALAVNAESDDAQKQAAQAFLAWLAQPENAAEFTAVSGQMPISGIEERTPAPQYAPVTELVAAGSYAPLPNAEWPNPGVYDAISSGVQGLLAGQGDVRSVLEAADRAWDRS